MAVVPDPKQEEKKPKEADIKVRKDLVQVFFGLVLAQMAVYFTSLIEMCDLNGQWSWDLCAAWTHLVLSFALTASSWFGWQMSMQKEKPLIDERSVFQIGFVLAVLDILLVALYFHLVHQIEMEGVAAFPPGLDKLKIKAADARPETIIMIVVFAIYLVWDELSYRWDIRAYRAWPSLSCLLLCVAGLAPAMFAGRNHAGVVVLTDVYLFFVVFLFRALKRLQKSNAIKSPKENTFRFGGWDRDVKRWVLVCFVGAAAFFGLALVCGFASWLKS